MTSSRRILVVDDYVDFADFLAMVLGTEGHEVAVAYDAPSAVEVARSFRPDIVVIDLQLSGMDGAETFAAIRRLDGQTNVRGIVVSGHRPDDLTERAMTAGFSTWLTKPFGTEDLLQAIRSE